MNNGRLAAILNFIALKFFKMHPLLKPHNLFYSNGVAIFQSDLPMLLIRSKCWVNFKVKVQKPEKAQLGILENMYVQYVIGPVLFEICSGNKVRVKTSK